MHAILVVLDVALERLPLRSICSRLMYDLLLRALSLRSLIPLFRLIFLIFLATEPDH